LNAYTHKLGYETFAVLDDHPRHTATSLCTNVYREPGGVRVKA
jgi:hypothetical protein